ncbi:MAG TPA: radical SAM protein [Syntrophorhabdales bacterium]|nr:radical SAM protein [Syntrophorhabdales bacterium]
MIVPVFLPHLGCRQKCIYCNQHHITGETSSRGTEESIRRALDPVSEPVEVAIYGGNPFGLGPDGLARLFGSFREYRKKIKTIRLSTEPIKPDMQVIDLLRAHNVTTVELGIPVFSDEKLRALGRRHTVRDLYDTYEVLTGAGFTVGIQVMVGLPEETTQDIRSTVEHLLRLEPAFIRIYPLVVLRDTPLCAAFHEKRFTPLSLEEAVLRALFIYLHAVTHSVKVIKMGLTGNEFLKSEIVAGPYHPAFGYLVRSEAFFLAILKVCKEHWLSGTVTVLISKKDVPHLIGHRRFNIKRFEEQSLHVDWRETDLSPGEFLVCIPERMSGANVRSRGRPSLRPGTPGGSEEPTQPYLTVRRGERRSDNEGIRVKGHWLQDAISMLPF